MSRAKSYVEVVAMGQNSKDTDNHNYIKFYCTDLSSPYSCQGAIREVSRVCARPEQRLEEGPGKSCKCLPDDPDTQVGLT